MISAKLPSGGTLKIEIAPFSDAKALYQAVLEELKGVHIGAKDEVANLFKDVACIGFSSKKIEAALEQCFKRCTVDYGQGDLKIDGSTFEPVERRDDYLVVCMNVAKENILPFGKSLYAEYKAFLSMIEKNQS